MSDYTFQRERGSEIIDEVAPLLERHWDEIAWTKELSGVDVDRTVYAALEKAGALVCVTARCAGALVGYAVYFVRYHPHYRTVKWAVSDVYWLAPEHRGRSLGVRMFRYVEQVLQAEGVKVMHTTGKTAHPQARRLLEALGHTEIEWGFGKILG
jgi:GNAT superfamily N-acetyltransferase